MPAFHFDNTYFDQLEGLYVPQLPERFPDPALLLVNDALAAELGLDVDDLRAHGAEWFGGTTALEGASPLAQAYAGHQFGGFSPQLGDGRAVLLGEFLDPDGHRVDMQLKGSGRTPFSRGGDGRATLAPVLREYLMGEAMHALGIPTTRALAAVTTGEQVRRQEMLPGALLVRIASSHLRVGTMQFFAARQDVTALRRLTDYTLARHYPARTDAENPALALLSEVITAQAGLIASWMHIGFVHGVMNTDNCTLSGETIDYGPCAFMGPYDPATVFSSIDHRGRYAYGAQPGIGGWNLTRLAEALLRVIDEDEDRAVALAQDALSHYADQYNERFLAGMRTKLGLEQSEPDDLALVSSLLDLLAEHKVDFTGLFRSLSDAARGAALSSLAHFEHPAGFTAWLDRWRGRLDLEGRDRAVVAAGMDAVNPLYIPRNQHVEAALNSAVSGDMAPFHRLLDAVTQPFTERPELADLALPATGDFAPYVTFCGT